VNCVPDDEYTELTPLAPVALLGVLVRITSPKFCGAKPESAETDVAPEFVPLLEFVPVVAFPEVVVPDEDVMPPDDAVPPEEVWAKLAALSARSVAMP
jgi:hypothetical protein